MSFHQNISKLTSLGVGLGLRRELAESTFAHSNEIDFLEITPENYMNIGGRAFSNLEKALSLFPIISHGVNLSIGSTDDLNKDYLKSLRKLLDEVKAPWWSDHFCFASFGGNYVHDLLPLPFNKEAVKHVSERAKYVQDYIERPFLLENVSFYMPVPGSTMSEAQFMSEIVEAADCGLLFDVNNVYVNSFNHKFDPRDQIDRLPLERVVEIHIAGHKRMDDLIIDTHGSQIIDPVFDVLEYTLAKPTCNPKAILLERDQNFPEFSELLAELSTIRNVAKKAKSTVLETSKHDYKVPA